ncbi:MAG: type II toxin-antitoxin system RelE/ParE family toxin [Candidatus Hydrogenedentes bacterium]|nr:type II toxin-antitoxin system RelE/ParE family toxin [Candidatus Hydrogenedentota bacterium]
MDDWNIEFYSDFYDEFSMLSEEVQDELLASLIPLRKLGPTLGRPNVDTLKASKHKNMKELRFNADDGVWRVAFAFDPERTAILLVAGDKSGTGQKRFYKQLIKKADTRFNDHLQQLKGKEND